MQDVYDDAMDADVSRVLDDEMTDAPAVLSEDDERRRQDTSTDYESDFDQGHESDAGDFRGAHVRPRVYSQAVVSHKHGEYERGHKHVVSTSQYFGYDVD